MAAPVKAVAQPMPARAPQPTPIARAVAAAMPSIATPTRAPQPEPTHAEPFFLAPRPAEPETSIVPAAAAPAPAVADPYAAAAMANGAAPAEPIAETPRVPRGGMAGLFKKVTGGARKPVEFAPEPIAPAQPRLGGLDPADRPAPAKGEDDLLEIPAFLRRQAN